MFLFHWTIDNDLIFMGWPAPSGLAWWTGGALCRAHTDPEQGTRGPELTNDDEYCSV